MPTTEAPDDSKHDFLLSPTMIGMYCVVGFLIVIFCIVFGCAMDLCYLRNCFRATRRCSCCKKKPGPPPTTKTAPPSSSHTSDTKPAAAPPPPTPVPVDLPPVPVEAPKPDLMMRTGIEISAAEQAAAIEAGLTRERKDDESIDDHKSDWGPTLGGGKTGAEAGSENKLRWKK